MARKLYFFAKVDEGHSFFESSDNLIEYLKNNTSEDEFVEVGSEELTDDEWNRLCQSEDEFKPYKNEDVISS